MERAKWSDERLDDRFERLRVLMYRMFGGLFVALIGSSLLHGGI